MANKQKAKVTKRESLKRKREVASDIRLKKKIKIDLLNKTNNDVNLIISKHVTTEQKKVELHDIDIDNMTSGMNDAEIKLQTLKVAVLPPPTVPLRVYSNLPLTLPSDLKEKEISLTEYRPMESTASEKTSEESPISPLQNFVNFELRGHRVIEINHFFEQLIKISGHESLFQCGLHSMEIKSEKNNSFISQFLIQCKMCKQQFKIESSNLQLNKLAVEGVIAAGCGHAQLKQISASLDIPIMSEHTYKINQDEVFDEWEVTAWESMKLAGEREREAALKENRIDKNGIPIIDVILDGCWCKRSYRTNYSALSGAAAIIGRRFGQVLFMAVKNKYCCICARAEKLNEVVKQHECFKNFDGPSTAMESTIIAEGFKKSVEIHGLIYSRFIADGDSSTYSRILATRPYTIVTVEKIGCKNQRQRW
ncbi:uncharacterized protein LOC114353576 [Ostrinia furnacalis]|uniref:uncharacterized protein LOC114353576 n=1 Tax=Ostrinia furnacalis TaxID=93504 RepID=UPI0010392FC5|nr:uncharacterized protein LOC114353576 [Ostrinia furnacalis]